MLGVYTHVNRIVGVTVCFVHLKCKLVRIYTHVNVTEPEDVLNKGL